MNTPETGQIRVGWDAIGVGASTLCLIQCVLTPIALSLARVLSELLQGDTPARKAQETAERGLSGSTCAPSRRTKARELQTGDSSHRSRVFRRTRKTLLSTLSLCNELYDGAPSRSAAGCLYRTPSDGGHRHPADRFHSLGSPKSHEPIRVHADELGPFQRCSLLLRPRKVRQRGHMRINELRNDGLEPRHGETPG
jgi:hypothetical protein